MTDKNSETSFYLSTLEDSATHVALHVLLPSGLLDAIRDNANHPGLAGLSREALLPAIADLENALSEGNK
jgi:hypothetical protein